MLFQNPNLTLMVSDGKSVSSMETGITATRTVFIRGMAHLNMAQKPMLHQESLTAAHLKTPYITQKVMVFTNM